MTKTLMQAEVTGGFKVEYLLASLTTAPAENDYTDGYQITIDATVDASTPFKAKGSKAICVQTLDSAGTAIAATVVNEGAHWLCMGFVSGVTAKETSAAATLKTVTHADYACYDGVAACAVGAQMIMGDLAISAANLAASTFTYPATNATDKLAAGATATFKWSQPKPNSDYKLTMRRYGAGDRVMVYQLIPPSGGDSDATTTVTKDFFKEKTAALLLAGASALATGVALGAATLAF